jgi:uncharacterized membrane protein
MKNILKSVLTAALMTFLAGLLILTGYQITHDKVVYGTISILVFVFLSSFLIEYYL